jgi:DNA-directed RNA polymerase subunit N (RpoN/RPB10)
MVLSSYCKHCNQTIGHLHIPYQLEIRKRKNDLKKNPEINNEILNSLGITRFCCRSCIMTGTVDRNLEEYLIWLLGNEIEKNK